MKGTFFVSQAVARSMVQNRYGRIINLSSQAGFVALPTESIYCASKAAISHLTKCLAVEWGEHNITVNAVAPTFIETPGTDRALADAAFRADVEERIAGLHRIGQPVDVTGAVVFLASSGGLARDRNDSDGRRRMDGACRVNAQPAGASRSSRRQ